MKRKDFIRNVLFGLAAAFFPKILNVTNNKYEFQPLKLLPTKLKEIMAADLKLQQEIIKSAPKGVYIDMKYFRKIIYKLKPEEAKEESLLHFYKMYKKLKNGME